MKPIKAKKLSLDALVQVIAMNAPVRNVVGGNISKPVKFGKFIAANAKEWGYKLIDGTHVDSDYHGCRIHFLELFYEVTADEGSDLAVITIVDGTVRLVVP